jgi:hypothetical protein
MRWRKRKTEPLSLAWVVLCLLASACVFERHAGTSSTALTVSFRDSGGPVRLTGDVELYCEAQNPWTAPSLSNTLKDAEHWVLDSLRLDSLFHALKASGPGNGGIPSGSTGFTFNILVRDRMNRGGILANLKYDSAGRTISDSIGVLDSASVNLVPLVDACGFLDADTDGSPFAVFTRGAPYTAAVAAESNLFVFHGLIPGTFSLRVVDSSGAVFGIPERLQAKPCPANPYAAGADVPHFTKGKISLGRIRLPSY